MTTDIRERFEITKDKINGVSIKSKATGRKYDLLEGKTYLGKATSDIVFIFELIDTEDGTCYNRLINYLFGASFEDEAINYCLEDIEDYEADRRPPLQETSLFGTF